MNLIAPMAEIDDGIVRLVKLMQLRNARGYIDITEFGITYEVFVD